MTRREKLEEQYEDAYFALLMDAVAEKEGARLEELNDQLNRDPTAAVPEEIDRRCRKVINRHFAEQRRSGYWRTTKRVLNRAAIVAAVMMLLFTSAFALSEDFRISALNLLITVEEQYTQLEMKSDDPGEDLKSLPTTLEGLATSEYFENLEIGWIPEGFSCVDSTFDHYAGFQNNAGLYFSIILSDENSVVQIDTENAESIEHLSINGVDTMRVFKDGDINCVMMDTDNGIFIRVWTSPGISVETNEKIAQNIKLILCASASAAAPQEALDIPEISPRYAYIRDTEADLEITGGLANCSASVSAPTSSYDVELTVELQQNRSGWDTIKTWTDAGTRYASAGGNWYVASGYDYRVKATATVYNSSGREIESATFYSYTESY